MNKRLSVISLIIAVITVLGILASYGAVKEIYSANGSHYAQEDIAQSTSSSSELSCYIASTADKGIEAVNTRRTDIDYMTADTFIPGFTSGIPALGAYIDPSVTTVVISSISSIVILLILSIPPLIFIIIFTSIRRSRRRRAAEASKTPEETYGEDKNE